MQRYQSLEFQSMLKALAFLAILHIAHAGEMQNDTKEVDPGQDEAVQDYWDRNKNEIIGLIVVGAVLLVLLVVCAVSSYMGFNWLQVCRRRMKAEPKSDGDIELGGVVPASPSAVPSSPSSNTNALTPTSQRKIRIVMDPPGMEGRSFNGLGDRL